MKKKHYYVLGAIVFIIVGIIAISYMYRRTPESVLELVTRDVFALSIEEANPQIFSFEEEWIAFGGDGYCKIGFHFDAPESFFRNFEKLPIKEKVGTNIPKHIKNSTNGYYLLNIERSYFPDEFSPADFYILVFDLSTHTGYLYYQFP